MTLPVDDVLDDVVAALGQRGAAVLEAPPGAGKTSRVPLALLDAPWLDGQRIVMLEPRRVAARAAARRLAEQLGGPVGGVVGHRMRNDTKVGPDTRIEVVTEGVLTRMLQSDPELSGVGVVVFDEFHERSIHADLGLALVLEARDALRDDLRVLVMSATLEGKRVAALMGDAPVVTSAGRRYDVAVEHHGAPAGTRPEDHMVDVVARIWAETEGDILGFLPGAGWIRRAEERLRARLPDDASITPLFGALSAADQDRALRLDPTGRRKVVLATDIAETSLTIDGVRVVVDSGLRRAPRHDSRTGLTRLVTSRVSQASADQRAGRAGRQASGVCHRLWAQEDHRHLDLHDLPEIAVADLSSLRLELAQWGARAHDLAWLDAPPASRLDEASALLADLGALDDGRITDHGRAMIAVGAEPRLAHMMVTAHQLGHGGLACDVAALLSARDPLDRQGADLRDRVVAMARASDRDQAFRDIRRTAAAWRRSIGCGNRPGDAEATGLVVALGFPDRIAQRRASGAGHLLASGRGAEVRSTDPLASSPYLAVAVVDGDPDRALVHLAAPLEESDLLQATTHIRRREPVVAWDPTQRDVVAEHRTTVGALVLKREPMASPPTEALAGAWMGAVRAEGLEVFALTPEVQSWRARVAALRASHGDDWPDLSDEALLAEPESWLAGHLGGVRRHRDLRAINLLEVLGSTLRWEQRRDLDRLAPTHLRVPTGNAIRLDYTEPTAPVLAVRVQELFGLTATPTIAEGRIDVVVHLLSPAMRPVQVTTDLAGFWEHTYPQVKAELKGRYPKHYWPDNPLEADPTDRTKRRR